MGSPEPRSKRDTRAHSKLCAIERLAADRDARLRGGAAHVEREDLVDAVAARGVERREHAARRSRFEQQDRRLGGGLARGEAAARHHDAQRRARRERVHAAVEPVAGTPRRAAARRRWPRSSTCARTRGSRARCRRRSRPRAAGKRSRIAAAIAFSCASFTYECSRHTATASTPEPADLVQQPLELGFGERRDDFAVARRGARRPRRASRRATSGCGISRLRS